MNQPPFFLPVQSASSAASFLLAQKGSGKFVLTLNTEILARCAADPAFARILHSTPYRLCDSVGVKWICKLYAPTAEVSRIPGIDLGMEVLALCAQQKIPVFLLGGKEGVALRAKEALSRRFPTLRVVGTQHGYVSPREFLTLREHIRQSGAKVIFVCLGSPLQERWILENRPALPEVELFLPLGGSLDVYAGDLPRAPRLWRRLGAEWLFRILTAEDKGKRICRLGYACGSLVTNHTKLRNLLRNFSLNCVESDNRV